MKIFLAQQNYLIGDFEGNTAKIIEAIKKSKKEGGDLIVFSELSICGYPARDFVEFGDFIEKCYTALETIRQEADTIGVLVGSPTINPNKKGKPLFNAALFFYNKQKIAEVHKTLLPTYDIFDEYRYFEPAYYWATVLFKGIKLAITICEDIWNVGENKPYRITPMDILANEAPQIIINLSASPYDPRQATNRKKVIDANVQAYQVPLIYCNAVGAQTEIIFDGGSLVVGKDKQTYLQLPYFEEALGFVEIDNDGKVVPQPTINPSFIESIDSNGILVDAVSIGLVHQALILGIKDYFRKMGFKKAILGSSGGIDSAVVLALAVEALGKENVTAVLMPSPYSTEHSVNDAVALSKNLDNPYHIIRINGIYESFLQTLEPYFNNLPFGVAEENTQSRTRGNLLMALANKHGYILLNTSNKSELATGYGTLYGDMAGGLGVLGDCYKLQVYALANHINRNGEIIPNNIIHKAPSAELRPNQKDSDSLPDYDILDRILYLYIEKRMGPREIKQEGFDPQLVDKTIKLVNTNEYKRNQFCPILRVSSKAFGQGRRMPIVGKYLG